MMLLARSAKTEPTSVCRAEAYINLVSKATGGSLAYSLLAREFLMKEQDLQLLKSSIDKVVKIVCSDGEIFFAKVHAISDEDKDVICDLFQPHCMRGQ